MSIDIRWENDASHILRVDLIGKWDSDDIVPMLARTQQMIEQKSLSVVDMMVVVINVRSDDPPPVRVLHILRQLVSVLENYSGVIVIVSTDLLLLVLLHLIAPYYRHFGVDVLSAPTVQQAKQLLLDIRL